MITIPGGTNGYLTPEFYIKKDNITGLKARKQDYFAFGATLFYLKYGKQMIKFQKVEDNDSLAINIIEKIQYGISTIRSGNFTDQDFIDFICSITVSIVLAIKACIVLGLLPSTKYALYPRP